MRQRIRINESQLRRIVKESVKRLLKEAIPGEIGMTDKEKIKRRHKRFEDEMNSSYYDQHEDDYTYPTYSDKIELASYNHDDPNWGFDKIESDRLAQHKNKRGINKHGKQKYPNSDFDDICVYNGNENTSENTDYYQDALEALEMSDCGITFNEWYSAFQDELEPEEAKKIFKAALKSYPIPW